MSPKQAERLRKQARQRRVALLRIGAIAGGALLLWFVWSAISGSQVFEVKNIKVTGNSRLSTEAVVAMADVPSGATLLRIDKDDIGARVARDPWVSGVTVKRRYPSTLVIDIDERIPVALVDTGVTFWFVDGDGRVLAETVPSTSTVMPVVRDLPDFVAEPGKKSESDTLQNTLGILRGLDSDLLATIRVITAPSRNETALLTSSSVEIMIGEAVQLEEKSILVRDILAEKGSEVVFIDVRSVERPVSRGLGQ